MPDEHGRLLDELLELRSMAVAVQRSGEVIVRNHIFAISFSGLPHTVMRCERALHHMQACQRPISPQIQHAFANKILKASHQPPKRDRQEMSRYETITCAIHACKLGHTEPEGGSKVGTEGLGRGGRHTICQKRFGPLTAVTCESAKYAV